MTAEEFIHKWSSAMNHLGLRAVGINVRWEKIDRSSKVSQFTGKEAWNKIRESTPPWFKSPQTFQELFDSKNSDYQQIIKEETDNGKIKFYRKHGIKEPVFCAFANKSGSFVLLGDGNHRFIDCSYLIMEEGFNLELDLKLTTLDIIFLENFDSILEPVNIWGIAIGS